MEWPTVALAVAIYGGWLAATFLHRHVPPLVLPLIGGWLIAWHGSLQHETIHGHPTRSRAINTAIGWLPLSLWLPYERYRVSHLSHHAAEQLTHPLADPEARYLSPLEGRGSGLRLALARAQSSLLGRLLIGPIVEPLEFIGREVVAVVSRPVEGVRIWLPHLAGAGLVLVWLKAVCGLELGEYLIAFVLPGGALTLLRSFAEHRAAPDPKQRIAIVEDAPVLGLLFLNNNLHAVHHAAPGAPWHRLPRLYRERRGEFAVGPVYRGYRDVVARYLLRPHDVLVHPGFALDQVQASPALEAAA